MKPAIEGAVRGLFNLKSTDVPNSMVIADLGCAAGPNTLALVSSAVDAVLHHRHAAQHDQGPLEVHVLLNDLPDNDFNDVAKRLVSFQQSTQSSGLLLTACIVPGSFYKRLFPNNFLDLIASSNSLHWLSEVNKQCQLEQLYTPSIHPKLLVVSAFSRCIVFVMHLTA